MKLLVEISLYPLTEKFVPEIEDFIKRLNIHQNITVWTNDASTQIIGDYDVVMNILAEEVKTSFLGKNKMVFVAKFLTPGV